MCQNTNIMLNKILASKLGSRERKVIVLIGSQWGDEGKGKVSDSITQYLKKDEYIVVGPNGGGNAGHNVVIAKSVSTGEKIKLAFHELPGGAVAAEHIFLAQGRIVNFKNLVKEIEQIELHQPNSNRKVFVASRSIVNIDGVYNMIEQVSEDARGAHKVGSTKQGIGPAYAGEALRSAITTGQLLTLSAEDLKTKIEGLCAIFPYLQADDVHKNVLEIKELVKQIIEKGKLVLVSDDFLTSDLERAKDKHILIEGSQSVGLGKFGGAYPNNTSSDCSVHGLLSSCLLPKADFVCAVSKAVVSKVGGGRFANKLEDNGIPLDFVDEYRNTAGEYGATTGRPRQVGFFDAVQILHSFKTGNRPDLLWINMGDMLKLFSDRGQKNKIVVGYKVNRFDPISGSRVLVELKDSIPLQEDEIQEIVFEDLPDVKDLDTDLAVWLEVVREKIDFKGPVVVGVGPGSDENVLFG